MGIINRTVMALGNIRINDIVDIIIVAFCIYKMYQLLRETRAEQLLKGILLVFVFAKISEILKLYTLNWILEGATTLGLFAIIVVFQPELRRVLEYLGRTNVLNSSFSDIQNKEAEALADEIVHAVASLSRQRIGALILFERKTGLSDVIETGTLLNADVSSELLINIFIPNTPLHDGAIVIKNNKIIAGSCFLPLSTNKNISKELGTRHRAALGISERSDCMALIVSEETGTVSIAQTGKITRYIDMETLKTMILNMHNTGDSNLFSKWMVNKDE